MSNLTPHPTVSNLLKPLTGAQYALGTTISVLESSITCLQNNKELIGPAGIPQSQVALELWKAGLTKANSLKPVLIEVIIKAGFILSKPVKKRTRKDKELLFECQKEYVRLKREFKGIVWGIGDEVMAICENASPAPSKKADRKAEEKFESEMQEAFLTGAGAIKVPME